MRNLSRFGIGLVGMCFLLTGCGPTAPILVPPTPKTVQQTQNAIESSRSGEPVIAVIGAGISGLAAASALQARGFSVTVVEARTRLGGRIATDTRWINGPVDMGASWIHGVEGNPITTLANTYNIKYVETDSSRRVAYDTNGRMLGVDETDEVLTNLQTLQTEITKRRTQQKSDEPLSEAIAAVMSGSHMTPQARNRFLYAVRTEIENEFGTDAANLSLFHFDTREHLPGEDGVFPGGYAELIRAMAKGLDIRVNSPVRQISQMNDRVVLYLATGEELVADYVISTLPLGVLKAGSVTFDPPLSPKKQTAITKLAMGNVQKIYLLFPSVFWDKEADFIGHVSQGRGGFAEFFNVAKYSKAPIIVAFNAGLYADMLSKLDDTRAVDTAVAVLQRMYGPDIPKPIDSIVTHWNTDPWSLGAYSYLPVGASPDLYEAMAAPEGRVFFAGEATSKQYPGTTHGAFLSGIREAERVAKILRP